MLFYLAGTITVVVADAEQPALEVAVSFTV
jgi:hypothetical protein